MTVSLLGTAARYFLEVANTGSLTRAAEQLHVAPSAISRQISKLEDSLGCALFERKARGMVLSEVGERLAVYARTTAVDAQRAVDEVKDLSLRASTRIRVACTEGFSSGFLIELMGSFLQRHPDSHLEVISTTPDGVSRLLLERAVDVGLKFSLGAEKGLHIEYQQPAPIMLVAARQHPLAQLAQLAQVSLHDVMRYPVAMPLPETTLRQMLELAFELEGLKCQAAFTANFSILLSLVASGNALTFAASQSVSHLIRRQEVIALPMSQLQLPTRYLQILRPEGAPLSALGQAFLQDLIAVSQS